MIKYSKTNKVYAIIYMLSTEDSKECFVKNDIIEVMGAIKC